MARFEALQTQVEGRRGRMHFCTRLCVRLRACGASEHPTLMSIIPEMPSFWANWLVVASGIQVSGRHQFQQQ